MRVTGSGMGCPDWPRCFGLIAPPTCSCQLPDNYQQIFLEKRIQKVQRFTAVLDKLGFHEKANLIRNNKIILQPEEFNVFKAWTEYINRIFGVIAGLLCLYFWVLSIRKRKIKGVLLFSGLALFKLILNAWLGSIVVATNLLPGIVTIHFLLSFLCIYFIMLSMWKAGVLKVTELSAERRKSMWVLFVLLMFEVVLGTLAREQVEKLATDGRLTAQNKMLDYLNMGNWFYIHRFLPGLIFLYSGWLYFRYRNENMIYAFLFISVFSLLQICFGAFNIVLVLPAWSQIHHIVLGSFLPVYAFFHILKKNNLNYN